MLATYIDPMVSGLSCAFDGALDAGLSWAVAMAVVGISAIACLVALDVARSRRRARAMTLQPVRLRRAA